jgi:hypothetical protein
MKQIIIIFALIVFVLIPKSFSQVSKEYILFSTAVFDVLQQDHSAIEGRVEYRGTEFYSTFKPLAGAMANTEGAVYFYAGMFIDIPVTGFLYITPSFAPGIYFSNGSKDLSFVLEFRSQIELIIKLDKEIRIGISFNHISNASLGILNPGVESIALTYHFPLH